MGDSDTRRGNDTPRHSAGMQDQDSAWKDIIERLFEDFLAFFFPEIYQDIDKTKRYTFLDKELQKTLKKNEIGKRYVDKLVKVYLTSGEEKWLLLHMEIQGHREHDLSEQIYIYNYRIFDRYRQGASCRLSCVFFNVVFRNISGCQIFFNIFPRKP